jgi:hypothetical protein
MIPTREAARRDKRVLLALAMTGVLRVKEKSEYLLWVARPEGHETKATILLDLETGKWQDRRSATNGTGLFAMMKRLGVDLSLLTAAYDVKQ